MQPNTFSFVIPDKIVRFSFFSYFRRMIDTSKNKNTGVALYLGSAILWLIIGTSIGEYLGIKFVSPEIDTQPWLSFGRLRPVHTNMVFWGWASMGMMGLAHYVVPRACLTPSQRPALQIWSAWFINAAVLLGSLSLMMGINNSGGEYREYIWPIAVLFGAGVVLSLTSLWATVRERTVKVIPISAQYIISAHIFVLVISFMAYQPFWQDGIGETIIQGYYMHQGVGMWFMMCTLGLFYYFIPQMTGRYVLSEQLGRVAFWSQIVFYTVIGTHHFIFSSIPWWLQVVAIIGSVGMIIPVVAGTINFLSCFRTNWRKVGSTAPLAFFLTSVVFYITGSLQGTAEAFQFTNLMWHFTDYTVAHSHLTMYGIITFAIWGGMYSVWTETSNVTSKHRALLRLQSLLSLIGLLVYTIPLMIGGSLRGLSWMNGAPFMESVELMVPFWAWRAIGGTLMWISHFFVLVLWFSLTRHAKQPITNSGLRPRNSTLHRAHSDRGHHAVH